MLKDKKILNEKKTLFERILISLQMFKNVRLFKSSRFRFIKSILPVYHKLPVLLFKILINIYSLRYTQHILKHLLDTS